MGKARSPRKRQMMKKGVGDEQVSRWTPKRRQTDDRHAPERKERLGRWRRMSEKGGMG